MHNDTAVSKLAVLMWIGNILFHFTAILPCAWINYCSLLIAQLSSSGNILFAITYVQFECPFSTKDENSKYILGIIMSERSQRASERILS